MTARHYLDGSPSRMRYENRSFPYSLLLLAASLIACTGPSTGGEPEPVAEKRVTFYTSYGYLEDNSWTIPLRIWVSEESDTLRQSVAVFARDKLMARAGLESLDSGQEAQFMPRVDGFIADSESNEVVVFMFDDDPEGTLYQLRTARGQTITDRNGLIEGSIKISTAKALSLLEAQNSSDGWLTLHAVSDNHGGKGQIRLIGADGVSIISDIDDTIKITDIPFGETEVIQNTFFREFRAAPCMPEIYSNFDADTAFHYVSGGPWQLYEPLHQFLADVDPPFPRGTFHMKNVRTNLSESESYEDIWRLVAGGSKQVTYEQKMGQISTLLRRFPQRNFILIGDSGERDPEVFSAIREEFPDQIADIRIRDIVNDRESNPDRLAGMTIIAPEYPPDTDCSAM